MINDQLVIKIITELFNSIEPERPSEFHLSIKMRDYFLSVLCLVLINSFERSKFARMIAALVRDGRLSLDCDNTDKLTPAEGQLLDNLSSFHVSDVEGKIIKAFEGIHLLISSIELTKLDAILLYEGVVQRLQEAKGNAPLATDFTYFYVNESLVEVIEPFVSQVPGNKIYDPFSQRGELLSYASALSNKAITYSEALKQSSLYIKHKLAIAHAVQSSHYQRSSLSADTTIDEGTFDFAVTACIASSSCAETPNLNSHDLKGHLASERIDTKVLDKTKFKEHALMQQMLWSLNEKGTALMLTGRGPLQREQEAKARAKLVGARQVACVIRLHDKALGGRAMPIYLVSLQKSGGNSSDILFIDARSLFSLDNAHVRIREKNNYLNIIKKRQNIEGLSRKASFVEVEKNSFNLCPEAYVSASPDEIEVNTDEIRFQLRQQIKITDKLFAELLKSGN
jgi:type I restriction-modification system DNA methylase subunit